MSKSIFDQTFLNAFKENITAYGHLFSDHQSKHCYFQPHPEQDTIDDLAVKRALFALTLKENNQNLISIILENANDALLMAVTKKIIDDDKLLPEAATILAPLVPRIIQMNPLLQKELFQGNMRINKIDIFSNREIRQYSDKKNDSYLNQGEFGVARLINKLNIKANALKEKKEGEAALKAHQLHNKLVIYYSEYLSSPNKNKTAFDTFKNKSDLAINDAKAILEKHRGWKNILANLTMHIVLLVTTLGLGNVVAAGIAYHHSLPGKRSLFLPLVETDSAKHVKDIEQTIKKIEPK